MLMMSEWAETHLPCPSCGSSDALSINTKGWGTCFSCDKKFPPEMKSWEGEKMAHNSSVVHDLQYETLTKRGITTETCRRYKYGIYQGRQYATYTDATGQITGQKVRDKDKNFTVLGDISNKLFGQNLGRKGGKMIVITEGEIDAMSVSQAMGNTWPAVSVPSGAQSADKAIAANLEYLESYDKVILCFDGDKPGRDAVEKCVALFSPGKAHITDLGSYKDANEMLQGAGASALRNAIWEAKEWRPDGVVNLAELKDRIAEPLEMGTQYPWEGLNNLLFGFRPQELITWTAGTGVGKTAVVSELVYHLITNGKKVGIVYLEEGVARAGKRIVGLHMNKPLHLPGVEYDEEEFDAAFAATLGQGRLVAYDHFGSLNEDVLLNRIRYMVKGLHCDVVVLDHISMVVSGADLDADERRMLDHTMTSLRSLTQETGASFHVVSHLRRGMGKAHEEGGQVSLSHLRGTQAIAQLSDAVVALERNQQADTDAERNTTIVRVLKNRYAGMTGKAASLYFNHKTGRLEDVTGTEEMTDDECPF
jgi:twinkle protein